MKYWVYLTIAGFLEVVWALGLKASQGFERPWLSIITILTMICSFTLLSMALKGLPVGTAYAIWTGIGAVGTAVFGMVYFGEPANTARIICLGFVVLGIMGLKFLTKS